MIEKIVFDSKDGVDYYGYCLENEQLKVVILEVGAVIQSFLVKATGKDIVLGYDSIVDYLENENGSYLGATIGRYCNRIENGRFTLDGVEYQLATNNGPNTLHGGAIGFDRKLFQAHVLEDKLKLTYISPNLEEGFPGTVTFSVTYQLLGHSLELKYEAISDQDTIVNFTQHSYFNLNEEGTIENHKVYINADKCGMIDQNGLTLDQTFDVLGTPFDFRQINKIGLRFQQENEQLRLGNGFDHHYCISGTGERLFATLRNKNTFLKVYSDFPGMHFYTGNFLDNIHGKDGKIYGKRAGVCFETQYYPNNINNTQVPKSILKRGNKFEQYTRFEVLVKED